MPSRQETVGSLRGMTGENLMKGLFMEVWVGLREMKHLGIMGSGVLAATPYSDGAREGQLESRKSCGCRRTPSAFLRGTWQCQPRASREDAGENVPTSLPSHPLTAWHLLVAKPI